MRNARSVLGLLTFTVFAGVTALGCATETSSEEDSVSADNAFTEESLAELRDRDPSLKKLKAAADDVEAYEISVKEIATPVPDAYGGIQLRNGYGTSGLDWFKSPNASYPDNKRWSQGSDTGKKCQWAAIFRFEKIFATPPAEAEKVREESTWSGRFWSWTDDYAAAEREIDDPTSSYAWSSGLWKWIGSSGKGDKCRLPTRTMVVGMMKSCLAQAQANGRDAKGCRMPEHVEPEPPPPPPPVPPPVQNQDPPVQP